MPKMKKRHHRTWRKRFKENIKDVLEDRIKFTAIKFSILGFILVLTILFFTSIMSAMANAAIIGVTA